MSSLRVLLLSSVLLACALAFPTDPESLDQQTKEVFHLKEDRTWPDKSVKFGKVSGIDASYDNNIYVFHRASFESPMHAYNENHTFVLAENGPIKETTISIIDVKTGKEISALGEDRFYHPHGLTVDDNGNIWVTDLALHQVMRFPEGSKDPDMVLGEKLVPGSDDTHFCKPTNVAVASNGVFFVTDGYCNDRVMKFNADGTLAKVWGEKTLPDETRPGPMKLQIPHSVTLVEKKDMVCVADKMNSRVQCFSAGLQDPSKTGDFLYTLFDNRGFVTAVEYDQKAELMYVGVLVKAVGDFKGYTVSMNGTVQDEWFPQGKIRSMLHDISVSRNGNDVYVDDVIAKSVLRFEHRPSTQG